LEEARRGKQIGSSLEAEIVITAKGKQWEILKEYETYLPTLFIVSHVTLEGGADDQQGEITVTVNQPLGRKCERCWNYRTSVGKNQAHPTICERCWKALEG